MSAGASSPQYDAFYRLRKVKNQSSTVLAEYRYNGLGHMIMVHEDTDADGDADASDVKFYPAYDEGWREVAEARHPAGRGGGAGPAGRPPRPHSA